MSNEIAKTQDENNPVTRYANSRDGFENFGSEGLLPILRCSKGDWSTGVDRDPAPDSPLLAIMPTAARGWVRWNGNRIVDHRINLVSENLPIPHRDSLGSLDEETWETGPDGLKRDPWQHEYSLVLVDTHRPHEEFIFKGSSVGAQIALRDLCRTYAAERHQYEGCMPVVSLAINTRRSPKYGAIKGPKFEIAGWPASMT
jgi:hypothetical protein